MGEHKMTKQNKKPVKPVVKPFLTGSPTDERTLKSALGVLGVLVIMVVMTFLVSSMLTMKNDVLRILLNIMVEVLVLFVLYSGAINKGAEAVARGEILYQRQEKGLTFAASERAICFHPLKGYITALIASIPILICGILLAVLAQKQTTGAGSLPGWLSAYQRRSDIGDPLVAYTAQTGMSLEDILRMIVRISLMPFVSMIGAENRGAMLLLERLSPLLMLLPVCAYGTGYLQGRKERVRIHTGIAENRRIRARREKKARKNRTVRPKTPEQLN